MYLKTIIFLSVVTFFFVFLNHTPHIRIAVAVAVVLLLLLLLILPEKKIKKERNGHVFILIDDIFNQQNRMWYYFLSAENIKC